MSEDKMKRKLNLFLVASFFSMQILTSLHTAEFGFEEHEHDGHTCLIYLHFCEHKEYGTPNAAIVLQTPEYVTDNITLPEFSFIRLESYVEAAPRAPPLFS